MQPSTPTPGRAARGFTAALALAAGLVLAPAAAAHGEAGPRLAEWAVYAGAFDLGTDDTTGEAGVEARFRLFEIPLGSFELPVEPAAGAMVHGDAGGYAYVSFRVPLHEIWSEGWPQRWRVVPFTGVGLYEAGDGKDLGGPVEFRSGVEVSYRMGERWWLGGALYHLSNAIVYDENPGEESLVVMLSWR